MKTIIEIASDLRKGNVKDIFNAIDGMFTSTFGTKITFEYSEVADTILEMVERYATGFVTEIANRFRTNGRTMSDKQRWCVAFAFQKLTDENVADYIKFCDDFVKNCEATITPNLL